MFCMATKELGKLTCQYLSKGFTLDKSKKNTVVPRATVRIS